MLTAFAIFTMLFSSCVNGTKVSVDIDKDWKLTLRDSMDFAAPDFDDSDWQNIEKTTPVVLGAVGDHYFWERKTISIPKSLQSGEVYLGFGRGNFATDIYADGVYIGSRGNLPPNYNMRIERITNVLIPKNCIHDNKVTLALRIFTKETDVENMHLTLDNNVQAFFQNTVHNIFTQRMFLLMATVCLFMMIYSIGQYASSKQISYLFFALSLFFISYYFYDMGCEFPLIYYPFHRSFSRASLIFSMSFLSLFLASFFKRTYVKKMLAGMIAMDVIFLIAYLSNLGKNSVTNTLFSISLLPTFAAIIYGYVIIIKAKKQNLFGSVQLIVGFIGGSLFAISDIIANIRGITPFIWTQGIAFFAIDMSVFVALTQKDGSNQKEIKKLAKETEEQKDRLSNVFVNAKTVAGTTSEISHSLTDSVSAVNTAVNSTQHKVNEIKRALDIQSKSQNETAQSIDNLTQFLESMNKQFEKQSALIESTANGISDVIKGIQSVGDGVASAADFSNGLSDITSNSSSDMKKLLDEMENVQESSKEILGVVTTLDTFAQQTNLLAMNASIEAAHSGEFGKGFAVIAREIKDLATQTSQWSAKIGEIITGVISQIQISVELCTKVNTSLARINSDSQESAKKVGFAAQSVMDQQAAGKIIAKESADLAMLAKKMQDSLKEQKYFAENVQKNMDALFNASTDVDNASKEIYNEAKSLSEESQNLIKLAKRTSESSESLTTIMSQKD